jgi:methionyl-tRNA formyltransferase
VRVVFFGSPDFALPSLEALLASTHKVVGVVTQPDRPAGRGLKVAAPPVKALALGANLPLLQPEKVNSPEVYAFLERLRPDQLVVVAYSGFLGAKLLEYCGRAPINVHPSLLPDLRGAAPMQWALLRGYNESGVTTQLMVKEMDAGDVLLQEKLPIGKEENLLELQPRMASLGGSLLVKSLDGIASGLIRPRPQDHRSATLAPLLQKDHGLMRFSQSNASTLHNQVRALVPWPGAHCFWRGKRVKVLAARPIKEESELSPGELSRRGDKVFVGCREGALEIITAQLEGKRALPGLEFLASLGSGSHKWSEESV